LSHGLVPEAVATVPAGADVDGAPGKEPVSAAQEAVLATVVSLITDVIGEEYAAGLDIGMQTTFQEDLELESIEFTALAERLIDTYGERVDFMGWLAEMDVDAIIAMTVGELVEFIAASGAAGQAD
jgi:acyl carrier protein